MKPTVKSLFFDLLKLLYSATDEPSFYFHRAKEYELQRNLIGLLKDSPFFNSNPDVMALLEELEDGHCTCEDCGIKGDDFKLVCSEDLIYLCPACEE